MIEKFISILTILGAFAGAWIYVDGHYATAADVDRLSKEFRAQTYDLRKRQVDDRIFELDFKKNASGKLSPLEQAQLDKYKRELDEIVTKQREADRK